jgi:DNA modification methylase
MNLIEFGDCRETMRRWAQQGVKAQMCVTSPPYFGLRSYLPDSSPDKPMEIGLEETPEQYIARMVEVFRCVRDVLADDGTLWLNIGDSYASNPASGGSQSSKMTGGEHKRTPSERKYQRPDGLKPKDLIGIPWMLAFALRADGWYLRQDIIWCLSGGAWVYARTQKGDMPVMVKDLVRLDPSTVKLWNGEKWTQVLGWGPSNDTSQRIELVLRSGERIGCTGGHLWPTQRGNVAARDLEVGDTIQTCRLPEPSSTYLTDGLLWLIGLYLAEGSRSGDKIQLSLHGDEKPWAPLIDIAAEQVGATLSYHDDRNGLNVRLYGGRVLAAVLDEYIGGKTAIDKHLTTKAWMLPDDALRLIAQGYLHGDGHDDGSRIRLGFCRNYALERDLRTLAARLGATLTLNPCTANYQGGSKPAFRGEWRWERSGHCNEKDRGEIVEIRASRARQFWDIAVEDDPHLFALASGVLTHNCKPNPMPESVRDRCTKAHEYVFLLSKGPRYFFDAEAMKEPAVCDRMRGPALHRDTVSTNGNGGLSRREPQETRNRRSVWTVATRPYKGAHFATFPPALIEPCILAGSRPGDVVLDPFMGSGTTAAVALQHGRQYLGCELNPDYGPLQQERIAAAAPKPAAKPRKAKPAPAADASQADLFGAAA